MARISKIVLQAKILDKSSQHKDWQKARDQWRGVEYYEDSSVKSRCQCTQQNIRKLWIIYNSKTKSRMKWIGSCCIKYFEIQLSTKPHRRDILPINNHNLLDYKFTISNLSQISENTN